MLLNSPILEVAIGLFFIYLVASLICSGISEFFAGLMNLRARRLREGINNILQDAKRIDPDGKITDLVEDFYGKPLVKGLKTPSLLNSLTNFLPFVKKKKSDPSYIPANVFARVLRDVLAGEEGTNNLTKDWHEVWNYLTDENPVDKRKPRVPKSNLNSAQRELLGVLKTAGLDGDRAIRLQSLQSQLVMARRALREFAMPGATSAAPPGTPPTDPPIAAPLSLTGQYLMDRVTHLEKSVQQAEKEVNDALERAQLYVEDYFNQAMERVSGWYKRNTQIMLTLIALFVTLTLNIDSLYIFDVLMKVPAIREAVVEQAVDFANSDDSTADATTEDGANSATPSQPNNDPAPMTLFDAIDKTGLNLGWNRCAMPDDVDKWLTEHPRLWFEELECPTDPISTQFHSTDEPAMWAAKKFIGMLLTVIAISLGAPFWFDLLNKAVNLRLTGQKPPEKSVSAQHPPAA